MAASRGFGPAWFAYGDKLADGRVYGKRKMNRGNKPGGGEGDRRRKLGERGGTPLEPAGGTPTLREGGVIGFYAGID